VKLKHVCSIIVFLSLTGMLFSCSSVTPGKTTATTAQIDTSKRIIVTYSTTFEDQVASVVVTQTPTVGSVYLIVDMMITNEGYDVFSPTQYNFQVTVDKKKYSRAFASYQLDKPLQTVDIPDGQTVEGKLCFEVPTKVTTMGYEIAYVGAQNYYIQWIQK
jgi:hypothetical protein